MLGEMLCDRAARSSGYSSTKRPRKLLDPHAMAGDTTPTIGGGLLSRDQADSRQTNEHNKQR